MEVRKVVKIRSSLLVVIPAEMCQLLGIEKGDLCKMHFLPPWGILLTKEDVRGRVPIQLERMASMKQAADNVYAELRRKARSLEARFSFQLFDRFLGKAIKEGLLELHPPKELKESVRKQLTANPERRRLPASKKGRRREL